MTFKITFADVAAVIAVIISIFAFIRATAALKMTLMTAEVVKDVIIHEEADNGKNNQH